MPASSADVHDAVNVAVHAVHTVWCGMVVYAVHTVWCGLVVRGAVFDALYGTVWYRTALSV